MILVCVDSFYRSFPVGGNRNDEEGARKPMANNVVLESKAISFPYCACPWLDNKSFVSNDGPRERGDFRR